jgi:hypothetical protein
VRLRVVLALVIAVLGTAAPALAKGTAKAGFPDLPGMKLADEATRGEVAPTQASFHRDDGSGTGSQEPAPRAEKPSKPDASSISKLPGTGMIPAIGRLASFTKRAGEDKMPRGLAALAALGTLVSVGGFLVFRDRLV